MVDLAVTVTGVQRVVPTLASGLLSLDRTRTLLVSLDRVNGVVPDNLWDGVQTLAPGVGIPTFTVAGQTIAYRQPPPLTEFAIQIDDGSGGPGTARTIAVWFRQLDTSGSLDPIALVKRSNVTQDEVLRLDGPGALGGFRLRDYAGLDRSTPDGLSAVGWHVLVLVWDESAGYRLYFDGSALGPDPAASPRSILDLDGVFSCGREPSGALSEGGVYAAGAYWNKALSAAQAARLYDEFAPPP